MVIVHTLEDLACLFLVGVVLSRFVEAIDDLVVENRRIRKPPVVNHGVDGWRIGRGGHS